MLETSRPLADMLWSRETQGGVFDTPEKRADLERTLFGVVSQIGDESVKRHYQQDMRDRLSSFFGAVEQPNARYGKQSDGQNRRGLSSKRFSVSESLMNSSLVKVGPGIPPLRETALLVTVINHPTIGLARFDELAGLKIDHPVLKQVHNALLNVFADAGETDDQPTPDAVKKGIENQDLPES